MDATCAIPCVIYAAKSTEDKRGSIPEQLRECRDVIESDPRRWLVAEYEDEAFSGYRRDRGPDLRDATQHAEDLAAEHGVAELWAQHSDRIARGDGRVAQHTVEVALWALKHDVHVRTLQDPGTFGDLLRAVVTGERNNEDSKRKGISTQAGLKRAAARGEFIGHLPDGYKLHTWLDEREQLHKEMVLDPERRPVIELIFRLALRGRSCGQIACTLNGRGHETKQIQRRRPPRPWDIGRVYEIVKNPRYAGLSVYGGEVMARGCWPAYITERQHERIFARLSTPQPNNSHCQIETYLLAKLARCGRCGEPMHTRTGRVHCDGSFARAYICSSHSKHRGSAQCPAAPIDAHAAEAMVVASIGALLATPDVDADTGSSTLEPMQEHADSHSKLREAALAEDPVGLERAIEAEFARLQPQAALVRGAVLSQRQERELAQAQRLRTWIEQEGRGRSESTRAQAHELNRLLRGWFSQIAIEVGSNEVTLAATRRAGAQAPRSPARVRIDRAAWVRRAPAGRRQLVREGSWAEVEILGALQAWAEVHGRPPEPADWRAAGERHPSSFTVRKRLGDWNGALRRAGLPPVTRPRRAPWSPAEVKRALRSWARRHGGPPRSMQWLRAGPDHPCAGTVRVHFGRFEDAVRAAGFAPAPREAVAADDWSREAIAQALVAWAVEHGRAPKGVDWLLGAPGRPTTPTVRRRFRSFGAGLEAAGLSTSDARRRS